jgi:hypothetical protein
VRESFKSCLFFIKEKTILPFKINQGDGEAYAYACAKGHIPKGRERVENDVC